MSEASEQRDEFELELDRQKEILLACQATHELQSCFNCEELFTCQTRKNYVDAAYNSMSKGNTGGFDF